MAWKQRTTVMSSGVHRVSAALALALLIGGGVAAQGVQSYGGGDPEIAWSQPVGAGDAASDEIDGISVDPSGNTVIAGVFRGQITLAGQTFVSRGDGDIFLASIAPNGSYRWARQFGAEGDDNAFDVTTDGAGNIIMSGWFSRAVDFGGRVLTSQGETDQFVAKFSPSGQLSWAKSFGGPNGDGGNEVAVLANGEIAVSGISNGEFIVEGTSYPFGGGQRDSYVLRLSPGGAVRWVVAANGRGAERIRALAINEQGNVYVGFQYRGAVRLGGATLDGAGDWDGAMARITSSGQVAWLLPVAGGGFDNVRGIGATPDGQVYAMGVFSGGAQMIDRRLPAGRGTSDFIVKVTPEGQPAWLLTMTGRGDNVGGELQVDQRGVIVSSMIKGPLQVRLNRDVVATFSPSGNRPSSYVAGFTHDGLPRFFYTPVPTGRGTGANGSSVSVSRDGRYLAQAIRFRQQLQVAGTTMRTPSKKDSGIIFLRLNGS